MDYDLARFRKAQEYYYEDAPGWKERQDDASYATREWWLTRSLKIRSGRSNVLHVSSMTKDE